MFYKKHPLARAVALSGIALSSTTFLAQAADQQLTENDLLEEIVITGTHIKGLDMDGAMQAVQLDREDIAESGAASAAEILRDLTQTGGGSGTFSTSTGGPLSGQTPVGAGGVSLRGLGTASTLTLVNGRRMSVSSFANGTESFIDVNSIPSAAIERVEVLPSGASATYGADAVAGVVNIILREDFEGSELSISGGNSAESTDEGRYNLNWVWGGNTENSNTMVLVDYYSRSGFYDRDRSISENSVRPSQQGIYPSFNDLFFNFYDVIQKQADGGCPVDQAGFSGFGEYCELDANQFASIDDEYESLGVVATHEWDISDRLSLFTELMYQTYKTQGVSSPAKFNGAPVDPESPLWPASVIADMETEGSFNEDFGQFSDYFGFPIFAWGALPEPRAVEVESESFRLVTGFKGQWDRFDWELAATYGRSESEQRGLSGLVKKAELYDALLGNICDDGTRIDRWEVDLVDDGASYNGGSCEDLGKSTLWYDPFNGQTEQMQGVRELIETQASREGESSVWSLDAVISGQLFSLQGRDVYGALGAEFRREEVEDTPSADATATSDNPEPILGFSSTGADYERDQFALFGEMFIPLSENFELQLAARYDDYDDFGSDINPKIGFRYQPIEALILRGNWSTSFRAPSLAQAGASTLLSSYSIDCLDTPIACNGDSSADGASLLSEDLGNPDLEPEEATTWGFGFVFKPTEDIDVSVDYWNIEHENLIGIDEDDFIRKAFAGEYAVTTESLPTGQPGLQVNPGGFVVDAHFPLANLGEQTTSGVDFAYTQYIDTNNLGSFTIKFDATYLDEFDRDSSDFSEIESLAGDYKYPRWLVNAKVRWRYDSWRASLSANYTHDYQDDPSNQVRDALGLGDDDEVDVSSWTVWDLSLSYDLPSESYVTLKVDNLFDREPPLVLGTGANVDHTNHSSMGRFVTLNYTHVF
ncbi:TonB-dependent receptor [Pseudomaricurvus alkylphenolicus]|uniref:TonB-dependent receptor plug domain-containing protein n=1 Tax=Pseudomaricurvus alkylphenolicus TaxID=1306991 RepID=UPI001422838B|nr:TonB-dependent receptor [Pseudomaricurvus alkylphenolicus]NIB41067.1 TonB-dependent receptor [Pseudomaricurvus alkylphenolicus]